MKKGVMQSAQQKDGCFKNRSNAIKKQPEYKILLCLIIQATEPDFGNIFFLNRRWNIESTMPVKIALQQLIVTLLEDKTTIHQYWYKRPDFHP